MNLTPPESPAAADMREAIERRLSERLAAARRRRAQRQTAQSAKDERRRHGLAARHARKLQRGGTS
ncbi:hypothetical protein [Actinomadura sp. BRA 177]|uniref:hypothetical protein n=1 Tax=Actinomadura sp. BRA 177 TaxID=2745202 RepID=UPI0015955907|nr:hypothetical protein [Actinomadura sp. BRA 177]NVI88235.1 hypothetical protein [Actinomadura sp. BRA 177]